MMSAEERSHLDLVEQRERRAATSLSAILRNRVANDAPAGTVVAAGGAITPNITFHTLTGKVRISASASFS
jgi:hypothetical protein